MTTLLPADGETHEVIDQVPPLVGHDVADDPALLEGLAFEGAGWHAADLPRRAGGLGPAYGTLPAKVDVDGVLARPLPA